MRNILAQLFSSIIVSILANSMRLVWPKAKTLANRSSRTLAFQFHRPAEKYF